MTPLFSLISHLECSECKKKFDSHSIQTFCPGCQAPLISRYSLNKSGIKPDELTTRKGRMWRWHEFLPVFDSRNIISLGEGDTPILALDHLQKKNGMSHLYLKDESTNPTHCFKARGLAAAISKARELGIKRIILPSAGNAGVALATYAAFAGISSCVIVPEETPAENIRQIQLTGAKLLKVKGTISDAGKLARQMAESEGWFDASTFREPYRLEGKKVMGFEIAEWLSYELPDVIIYPTGGGTGLVGIWKAFQELLELGWLKTGKLPRMVAVQSTGCASVIRAIENGDDRCKFWEDSQTIAAGLRVPISFADRLILRTIRESHGTAVAVSDGEMIEAQHELAIMEGIFVCPEGAATLAALERLLEIGKIQKNESVVLLNTGSGLINIAASTSI
jgi:threonine synthase